MHRLADLNKAAEEADLVEARQFFVSPMNSIVNISCSTVVGPGTASLSVLASRCADVLEDSGVEHTLEGARNRIWPLWPSYNIEIPGFSSSGDNLGFHKKSNKPSVSASDMLGSREMF